MQNKKQQPKSSAAALRVIITQQRIEASARCHSNKCMIAESIKDAARAVGWLIGRVRVDLATMRFTDIKAGKRYVWLTPQHARAALILFDSGQKPREFGFVLRRCDAAQVIDSEQRRNEPAQVARRAAEVKITTRNSNKHRRTRLQSVTIIGGKPLPLMPRQTTRMFGFCGMTKELMHLMSADGKNIAAVGA